VDVPRKTGPVVSAADEVNCALATGVAGSERVVGEGEDVRADGRDDRWRCGRGLERGWTRRSVLGVVGR